MYNDALYLKSGTILSHFLNSKVISSPVFFHEGNTLNISFFYGVHDLCKSGVLRLSHVKKRK